jgi:hypothetical protein
VLGVQLDSLSHFSALLSFVVDSELALEKIAMADVVPTAKVSNGSRQRAQSELALTHTLRKLGAVAGNRGTRVSHHAPPES